jgi:hypothetical protein
MEPNCLRTTAIVDSLLDTLPCATNTHAFASNHQRLASSSPAVSEETLQPCRTWQHRAESDEHSSPTLRARSQARPKAGNASEKTDPVSLNSDAECSSSGIVSCPELQTPSSRPTVRSAALSITSVTVAILTPFRLECHG